MESRLLKLLGKSNKKSLLLDLCHCNLPPMFRPNSRIFEPRFGSLGVLEFLLGTVTQNRIDNPKQLNEEMKTLFIFPDEVANYSYVLMLEKYSANVLTFPLVSSNEYKTLMLSETKRNIQISINYSPIKMPKFAFNS